MRITRRFVAACAFFVSADPRGAIIKPDQIFNDQANEAIAM